MASLMTAETCAKLEPEDGEEGAGWENEEIKNMAEAFRDKLRALWF